MTVRKLKYILFTLAPLSAMLMTGCLDEPLADTDCFDNPDVISFTAVTAAGGASTRSGGEKQLYEPLVLTDDAASQTLYLHTYDSERIGFKPGDDVQSDVTDGAQTRGNQIETADDLIKFHKDFMVHAQFKEDGVEYIEWSKTQYRRPIISGAPKRPVIGPANASFRSWPYPRRRNSTVLIIKSFPTNRRHLHTLRKSKGTTVTPRRRPTCCWLPARAINRTA